MKRNILNPFLDNNIQLFNDYETPAQTVTVAKDDTGDFTIIKEALDSITDASPIKPYIVYIEPGFYVEDNMILNSNIRILGKHCFIQPNSNGDFITVNSDTQIKGCSFIQSNTDNCLLLNGTNINIKDCGFFNGTGTAINATSGSVSFVRDIFFANINTALNCDNAIVVGVTIAFQSLITGIQIDNGSDLKLSGVGDLGGVSMDIIQLDDDSKLILPSGFLTSDKMSIRNWDNIKVSYNDYKIGDEGLNIIQELHVGTPQKGFESVFGEGDSYTYQMMVYSFDNSTSSFSDISLLASTLGNTFTFANGDLNDALYISCNQQDVTDYLRFYGIKAFITSANTGQLIIAEYWDGSTWKKLNTMSTESSNDFKPFGNKLFERVGSEHIRFNNEMLKDWTKNDPIASGIDRYWVRFRSTANGTNPVFEQFKLHPNRTELNACGWMEYFGKARPSGTLPWSVDDLQPWQSSPSNQDLYSLNSSVSSDYDLGVGRIENRLNNGARDKFSLGLPAPVDLDTSCPIKIEVYWVPLSSTDGNVFWKTNMGIIKLGDTVADSVTSAPTSILGENNVDILESVTSTEQFTLKRTVFTFDVEELIAINSDNSSDNINIMLSRDAADGADTYSGNIAIWNVRANYTKWTVGGHIN